MFFSQIEFVFFMGAIFLGLALCRKNNAWRKNFLLVSSCYFYGYWDIRFLGLLMGCITVNYGCAAGIGKFHKISKMLMLTAVIFNLALLCIFKYYNFFMGNLMTVFSGMGWNIGSLKLILPLGISFFTFQNISYIVDVYKKQIPPCKNFRDFALFILFFPKLTVGPLVRASDFLPQLATSSGVTETRIFQGGRQFMFGLFKKVFIADHLALFVDPVFANHSIYDGVTLWVALAGYTLQIYCDFSGYSDMAIGIARMMGFDLAANFNSPYLATSVTDFWRRWHISLSSWLRDYLYIPLGGNRNGKLRSYWNIFVTMVLGGLWHGAAWTFIFWGAWHGGALALHKYWHSNWSSRIPVPRMAAIGLTLGIVMIGWLFFRASSFRQAYEILCRMFSFSAGVRWLEPMSIGLLFFAIGVGFLQYFKPEIGAVMEKKSVWTLTALMLMLLMVIGFRPSGFQPFIYNQF